MNKDLLRRILSVLNLGYRLPDRIVKEIQEELAKPNPEPIGYMKADVDGWYEFLNHDDDGAFPVYRVPPCKNPLSDNEIVKVFDKEFKWKNCIITFARSIEKAHGIGE